MRLFRCADVNALGFSENVAGPGESRPPASWRCVQSEEALLSHSIKPTTTTRKTPETTFKKRLHTPRIYQQHDDRPQAYVRSRTRQRSPARTCLPPASPSRTRHSSTDKRDRAEMPTTTSATCVQSSWRPRHVTTRRRMAPMLSQSLPQIPAVHQSDRSTQ